MYSGSERGEREYNYRSPSCVISPTLNNNKTQKNKSKITGSERGERELIIHATLCILPDM